MGEQLGTCISFMFTRYLKDKNSLCSNEMEAMLVETLCRNQALDLAHNHPPETENCYWKEPVVETTSIGVWEDQLPCSAMTNGKSSLMILNMVQKGRQRTLRTDLIKLSCSSYLLPNSMIDHLAISYLSSIVIKLHA